MSKVIAISNQKGGVGKTTTAINLGVSLAKLGKRVLLIDFDPQANLTMALGFHQPDEIEHNIAHLLQKEIAERANPNRYGDMGYVLHAHDIDFIPASIELSGLENILINTMSRENVLKSFISAHKDNYDYILIDCMPSLNILTVNAFTASDEIIIPVQPQYLSVKGLELLLGSISSVKANLNPYLKIAGIVTTMFDKRSAIQKRAIEIMRNNYGGYIKIFDSVIPMSVKVSDNQSRGLTMAEEKNNNVTDEYANLAKELLRDE